MGGAVEQVTGGVVTCTTRGTGGVSGHADPRSVRVEERAIAGAELGEGSSVGAGKGEFLSLDRRGTGLKDGAFLNLADCGLHCGGVEVCEGGLIGGGVHSGAVGWPTREKVGHGREEKGLKGLLLTPSPRARARRHNFIGGVGWAKGAEEELGTEEGEMVVDGEDLGLRVKMVMGGHPQRPSGDSEGGVLDPLEFEDSRGRCIGEPDGGSVGEQGAN